MVNTSTKIAIQAAVAVALAVLVSHVFELNRSYWAILTAMVLISQTWGESLKKGPCLLGALFSDDQRIFYDVFLGYFISSDRVFCDDVCRIFVCRIKWLES
jgi:hypothetical protein